MTWKSSIKDDHAQIKMNAPGSVAIYFCTRQKLWFYYKKLIYKYNLLFMEMKNQWLKALLYFFVVHKRGKPHQVSDVKIHRFPF